MKKTLFVLIALACWHCQPKAVVPATEQIGKIWKAQTVKENGVVVYQAGNTSNIRPSYVNFRLDLSKPNQVILTDLDGRKNTGTWLLSTDNKRLILQNLNPIPSETNGNIEFYVKNTPTETTLELERTAESRKTGNTINQYVLIPE